MIRKLYVTAICLVASMSVAAQRAPFNENGRGATFEMCDAKSSTGTCDNADGVDVYAIVDEYSQFTVFFSQDSGTLRTCDLYGGDQDAFNNLGATLSATDGTKMNSVSLSDATNQAQSFEAPFFFMFVICANGTGTHSVLIQAAR